MQSTHIFCVFRTFFQQSLTVNEIMWKNVVEQSRPHLTIWRMRIACWVRRATNTHSGYAVPLQQLFHERASILRYTYIVVLFNTTAGNSDITIWPLYQGFSTLMPTGILYPYP
jgi:hypothetical protein